MSAVLESLVETATAIASGNLLSVDVTQQCLDKISTLNPQLNCFTRVRTEKALTEAHRADQARRDGHALGPLHGVPIALKDMFYDPPEETASGSTIRAGFRGNVTATIVTRLRNAGAIDLGALHMTEFAMGPTGHNEHLGPCRNPWDPARISGGSSSGAGSALAARLCFAAVGSDTAGSIRTPAAACGVMGFKPTYGRIPRSGAMPLAWSLDHIGPLARNARDLARLMEVLSGHDPADTTSSRRAVPTYETSLKQELFGRRIGVPAQYFLEDLEPSVADLMTSALETLRSAGATLVTVHLPKTGDLVELTRLVMYAEASAAHAHWLRTRSQDYSSQVATRLTTGAVIPATLYLEALQYRAIAMRRFCEAVFAHCDVLATPTLPIEVPTIEATDVGSNEALWQLLGRLGRCVAPVNYLGLPALAMPIGFSAARLPASLQLIGRPFAEQVLLDTAASYQALTDWHRRRPPLS